MPVGGDPVRRIATFLIVAAPVLVALIHLGQKW